MPGRLSREQDSKPWSESDRDSWSHQNVTKLTVRVEGGVIVFMGEGLDLFGEDFGNFFLFWNFFILHGTPSRIIGNLSFNNLHINI